MRKKITCKKIKGRAGRKPLMTAIKNGTTDRIDNFVDWQPPMFLFVLKLDAFSGGKPQILRTSLLSVIL
jgi:hypothetical protein